MEGICIAREAKTTEVQQQNKLRQRVSMRMAHEATLMQPPSSTATQGHTSSAVHTTPSGPQPWGHAVCTRS